MTYDNTNTGVLFKESSKKTEDHPDYSGNFDFDGVACYANGWLRGGEDDKHLSVSLKEKEGSGAGEGSITQNKNKTTDRHPDYKGSVEFDGNTYGIAGWKRVAKNSGKNFISIRIENKKPAQTDTTPVAAAVEDDDIPF